jgi:hypothetical protein
VDVDAVAHFTAFIRVHKIRTARNSYGELEFIFRQVLYERSFCKINKFESVLIQILKLAVVMLRVNVGIKRDRNIIGNYFIAVFQPFADFFIRVGVGA